MALDTILKGTKIIETIENYSLATIEDSISEDFNQEQNIRFYNDEEFWMNVTQNPDRYWNAKISLRYFVISSWIARVPGLYWTDTSKSLRQHLPEDIAIQSDDWIELYPPGKSKKVLGGVGTLLFPPSDDGKILMSVTSSCNASLGIPVLIFPDVFDFTKIKEGDVVNIHNASWQPMGVEWSKKFPTTSGIPRGYLIIDKPEKISIHKHDVPIIYQPFSIMEYDSGSTRLYDFVYLSVDSHVRNAETITKDFFESYSKKDGRYGSYILNPNMVNPLFETLYSSPTDLQKPSEKAQLELLYQRIRNAHFGKIEIDKIIRQLPGFYSDSQKIRRLAQSIGINPAFLTEDNAVSMSAQLLKICIDRNNVEELIDRAVLDYPLIFK